MPLDAGIFRSEYPFAGARLSKPSQVLRKSPQFAGSGVDIGIKNVCA
jgi:hypothetical protein